MKQRDKSKWNIVSILIFSSAMAVIVLWIIKIRPIYAINDDWGLYDVLNGAFLGTPGSRIVFMKYPLSWLLCSLYRMAQQIDWYGLFLETMFIVCAGCIFYRLYQKCKNGFVRIYFSLLVAALWVVMTISMMVSIQYTVVAGICGATAVFMYVTSDGEKIRSYLISNIPTVLLALTAYMIRPEMLYMLLPVTGMVWIAKLLCEKTPIRKRLGKQMSVLILFLAGFLLIEICHHAAYADQDWSDFIRKDRLRVSVFDYTGYADYDSNSEVFEQAGISKADYNLIKEGGLYIGQTLTVGQWQVIAEVSGKSGASAISAAEKFARILPLTKKLLLDRELRPISFLAEGMLFISLFWVIFKRKKELIILFSGIVAGQLICWFVLAYRGRVPMRIEIPYLWVWIAALSGMWMVAAQNTDMRLWTALTDRRKKHIGLCVSLLLLGGIMVLAVNQTEAAKDTITENSRYEKDWNQLKDYCNTNDDFFYVWSNGSNTLAYYCDRLFDSSLSDYENYVSIGSGHMMNPNTKQKLLQTGISDLMDAIIHDPDVLLVYQKGSFSENHYLLQYYLDKGIQVTYELVDDFSTDHFEYEVYEIDVRFGG